MAVPGAARVACLGAIAVAAAGCAIEAPERAPGTAAPVIADTAPTAPTTGARVPPPSPSSSSLPPAPSPSSPVRYAGTEFVGEIDEPAVAAPPALPADRSAQASVLIRGAWTGDLEIVADPAATEYLLCGQQPDQGPNNPASRWFAAASAPAIRHPIELEAGQLMIRIEQRPVYKREPRDGKDLWRLDGVTTEVQLGFDTADGTALTAYAHDGGQPLGNQPAQFAVSDDLQAVAFSAVAVAHPEMNPGDLGWAQITGTIVCPEPLSAFPETMDAVD